MIRLGLLGVVVVLGACTPSSNDRQAANGAAPAKGGRDYVAEVRNMAPKLRQATFLRAVRDAGQACQQVIAEQPAGKMNGLEAWTLRCEDQRGWMITIAPDGNAKVTGPIDPKRVPAPR